MKYEPAAFDCGLFQVDITSRKYALQEEEITTQTRLQQRLDESLQRYNWTCVFCAGWPLTFLDFLLSLCPLYQSSGEENHVKALPMHSQQEEQSDYNTIRVRYIINISAISKQETEQKW